MTKALTPEEIVAQVAPGVTPTATAPSPTSTAPAPAPKSNYNIDDLWADMASKETPRTVQIKGDSVPIISDDPPFSLLLRLPFNALSTVDKNGKASNPAKLLFDAVLGPGVYEHYTNEDDKENCLTGSQVQALYLFFLFGFDMERVRAVLVPTEEEVKNV